MLEPLETRAGDEHAALERIRHIVADTPGNRRDETVLRMDDLLPRVHEQERTLAVGVLRLALGKTRLAEEIRLLVADAGRDRDGGAEARRVRIAIEVA